MALIAAGTFILLLDASGPRIVIIIGGFLTWASIEVACGVAYLIAPEAYETKLRASGHGWSFALANLGAIAVMFWANSHISLTVRLTLVRAPLSPSVLS